MIGLYESLLNEQRDIKSDLKLFTSFRKHQLVPSSQSLRATPVLIYTNFG